MGVKTRHSTINHEDNSVVNSTTKVKGKIVKFDFSAGHFYGSYTERTEIPEFVYGPYDSTSEPNKKIGFNILCGRTIDYYSIPIELKPYAQNIIKIESKQLNGDIFNLLSSFILLLQKL